MSSTSHSLLRVLRGEAVWPPPVWVMRQAGRTLPAYQTLRARAGSFKTLVQTPTMACEATLLAVEALRVDAAILFSDILVLVEAMGFDYALEEGKGITLERPLTRPQEVGRLVAPDPSRRLGYVLETIQRVKTALRGQCPLIGFSGAPWTLFAYLTQGHGHDKEFKQARRFYYEARSAANEVLDRLTHGIIEYLHAQIDAGIEVAQLFDSWAGLLPPHEYIQTCVPRLQQIAQEIQPRVPLIIFAKDAHGALQNLTELPCAALSIDWRMDLQKAARALHPKPLQGNWDPAMLYAPKKTITQETKRTLKTMKGYPFIANLGHGLYPDSDVTHVKHWIACIQNAP